MEQQLLGPKRRCGTAVSQSWMGNHFEHQNFQPKSLKTCLQYLVLVAVPPLSWRKNLAFSVSRYLIANIYYMYASMRMLSCANQFLRHFPTLVPQRGVETMFLRDRIPYCYCNMLQEGHVPNPMFSAGPKRTILPWPFARTIFPQLQGRWPFKEISNRTHGTDLLHLSGLYLIALATYLGVSWWGPIQLLMDILTFSGVAPPASLLKNCSIFFIPEERCGESHLQHSGQRRFSGVGGGGGTSAKGFSLVGFFKSVGMKFGYIRFFWFRNPGSTHQLIGSLIVYPIIYQVVSRFSYINSVFEIVWVLPVNCARMRRLYVRLLGAQLPRSQFWCFTT